MKYCPTCGKEVQYDAAEICPNCGCRLPEMPQQKRNGPDRVIVLALAAILIILCLVAIGIFLPQYLPAQHSIAGTLSNPGVSLQDNSLSVGWNSMADWAKWEISSNWSGTETAHCSVYGPSILKGYDGYGAYGEYGSVVHLQAGSTESSIQRTFTDPAGKGWNTLTLVGSLSASDVHSGRWLKIEVNDNVVFDADATRVPPGDGVVFAIPVHFTPATTVKVKISNGQKPAWGGSPFFMDYYSLRLSSENYPKS